MALGTFATAINCMDGRTILPVTEWMKHNFQVDYVDMITEAGPDKVLSQGTPAQVQSIKDLVSISVEKHNSKVIALIGHHDCA
ncbi:MAG: carbonic anhydrase, partial [Planctomycetota bacterium]